MKQVLTECRLYGIADTGYVPDADTAQCTRKLCTDGVHITRLRANGYSRNRLLSLARRVMLVCREFGCLFALNGERLTAAELGADGVHVGQDTGTSAAVRYLVGQNTLVGRSDHSLTQARDTLCEGAAHIGFGTFPRHLLSRADLPSVRQTLLPYKSKPGRTSRCFASAAHPTLPCRASSLPVYDASL